MIFNCPEGPVRYIWAAKISFAEPKNQPNSYSWPKGPAKDCRTHDSVAADGIYTIDIHSLFIIISSDTRGISFWWVNTYYWPFWSQLNISDSLLPSKEILYPEAAHELLSPHP